MREKEIERALVREVRNRNGMAFKFVSPGVSGVPDRLILLPDKKICFAEMKAPGKTMRPLQMKRKKQIEALGFRVYCIDSNESIGVVLNEIQST